MPFKSPHPLYSVWQGMRRRCISPTYRQWNDYGGRGIRICPEWDDFHQFVHDMGPRPSKAHSLDRIDNDGNYEPSNCRWATRWEQQRNRRTTKRVIINGKEYLICDLALRFGLKPETIEGRAKKGMTFEQVTAKTRYAPIGNLRKATEARVRNQRNATHCKNGHPWTPENTYITKEGWKNCRQCHNARTRKLTAAKRASRNSG